MTTFAQAREMAQRHGLTVEKAQGFSQVRIRDASGRSLDTCGTDAVPAWLSGFRAGRRLSVQTATCSNPACDGGFIFRRDSDGNLLDSAPCDMC